MNPEVIATLIGAIIGLIGGASITYWGAISLSKRQATSQAAMKFIAAFSSEIALLKSYNDPVIDQLNILETSLQNHLTAIVEFKSYLEESDRISLDKAWCEYYCDEGDPNQPFLEQYSVHIADTSLAKENRDLALSRLQNIISHAEKKL
jgi:hypothetical protein